MTSAGPGVVHPATTSKMYYVNKERDFSARSTKAGKSGSVKYDSVTLSKSSKGEGRDFMDMVSRLSQEVRTSTTTGDIQSLRQQVVSGSYTPDPMNIAARMLMLGDER